MSTALSDGVRRFQAHAYPNLADHFEGLRNGQSPPTLFITCSDSRIDPALIAQTLPGEIFVVRNAGNLTPGADKDPGGAAAIEYAVHALKVQHIVVCGHAGCGAMGGLLAPESLGKLPAVAAWVENAKVTRDAVADHPAETKLSAAVAHNALTQLDVLRADHPGVAEAEAAGDLTLTAWVYDIASGRVDVLGKDVA
jgi:carbonic anhydrase